MMPHHNPWYVPVGVLPTMLPKDDLGQKPCEMALCTDYKTINKEMGFAAPICHWKG